MIYIIYQLFWHKTSNLNDTYDNNHHLTISHQEPLIHALLVLQVLFPSDFFNLYVFLIENHVLGCYFFDFVLSVLSHKLFSSQYNILFYLFCWRGLLFCLKLIKSNELNGFEDASTSNTRQQSGILNQFLLLCKLIRK